ncbi:hypothetical protein A8V01_14265 [Novosphingobium guangzhouense]|uniref:Lipoprotein n=2 Tax=Novosphingobium guangzhouense TaxID=1850347 RepID=A0A2K2G4L9_9SPHN|nr:hypothetical protein A8V01_14265 [Novosphingobium guangzhouense]
MGCSAFALAGCGADDISSPGAGSIDVDINNPAPTPTPTPGTGLVEAASECPGAAATGGLALSNDGIITGPEGSWRVCTLPSLVNVSSTLPKQAGVIYRLNGRVDVGCDGGFAAPTSAAPRTTSTVACGGRSLTADTNVTLTIEPGVIVYGDSTTAASWLAVNRGNKLIANGTATSPIIFTSLQNVRGSNNNDSQGQWGGVVLLGRGITTDCSEGMGTVAGQNCERVTEGAADPANFGGRDNTYNAGSLQYVQIRFSGYSLAPGNELQSLTGGGIGTGTTLDYIQSVNSSDDGSEFFGGAMNMKHYIAVNADDDSLDLDTGVQANVQYALLLQKASAGDAFFEFDSNGNEADTPRTHITVGNFTAIQTAVGSGNSGDQAGGLVRGNADATFLNGVIYTPDNECLRVNGSAPAGTDAASLAAHSVVMTCGGDTPVLGTGSLDNAEAAAQFNAGTNNNATFTSTLTSTFVNGAGEGAVTPFTNYASLNTQGQTNISSFFTTETYIGAVENSSDLWFRGWTCDTTNVSFGSNSACTALPTT